MFILISEVSDGRAVMLNRVFRTEAECYHLAHDIGAWILPLEYVQRHFLVAERYTGFCVMKKRHWNYPLVQRASYPLIMRPLETYKALAREASAYLHFGLLGEASRRLAWAHAMVPSVPEFRRG